MKTFKQLPDNYRLGISSVDKQHAQIIALLEDTVKSKNMSGLERETIINDIILDLKTYAKNHFQHEESLMKKIHYVDIDKHIESHKVFIEKLSSFQTNTNRYKEKEINDLVVFLKDWFLEHINKVDRKYIAMYEMYQRAPRC